MKSAEGSYLLSEVKWAIAPEIGVVHPFVYMQDKDLFYDLFTHRLLAGSDNPSDQFSRHYGFATFECVDTEIIYCVEIKTLDGLTAGFGNFLENKNDYLDSKFCGEIFRQCKDTFVTIQDLYSFANKIKESRKIGDETIKFSTCEDDPLFIPYRERRKYKKAI